MKNILLILAISLASSVSAQICGQMFIAPAEISYDAKVTYYHSDGTVDWECVVDETNYLLIPSCSTQSNYIIELTEDDKLLDKFVVQYKGGNPVIAHIKSSGLIQCVENTF